MLKPFFVMLHCQNGGIAPMVQEDEELATYDDYYAAEAAALDNPLGRFFGFEIFCRGNGEGI